MNRQEEEYFEALSKDRADSANTLEKPSMRGIKHSVVEKYSDQAHFIYELLQNADDVKATNARFVLESDRLIFAHNGTRHFSVSNPSTEEEDSDNGLLGDINAITSIANSNKTEASIGKFGVGFKAVFQYTSTPHIYDPEFRFRIDRFIVPTLLSNDFPTRQKDETLFVFPFDHPERSAAEAYDDISDKLRNLSFPLLFLTNLRSIEFQFSDTIGLYDKTVKETYTFEDTSAEQICLTQNAGEDFYDKNLWLFSRSDERGRKYCVGFFLDEEGHLQSENEPAFCFFPTKEVTNLDFIIHAPFLLTDSREGIKAGVAHNDTMIKLLSELAADALEYLRDIGRNESVRLIDDTIVHLIPFNPESFSNPADKSKVSFLPFYTKIKEKLGQADLLPTKDGYTSSQNAYWAEYPQLPRLFSDDQLSYIVDNQNAHWVFPSIGRYETNRNNKALFTYIESIVKTNINEDAIISGRSVGVFFNRQTLESVKGITASFIEVQPMEWLHKFYKWLLETNNRREIIKNKPVFLDQDGHAAAAYDKDNQLILFLPTEDISGYTVVHPDLLENADTVKFIEALGIKEPSLKDQIYNTILPQYQDDKAINTNPHFKLFFKYYRECPQEEIDDYIELIKNCKFLKYYSAEEDEIYRGCASSMYFPTEELTTYFRPKKDARFITYEEYRELIGNCDEKQLKSFLVELGVKDAPSILERKDEGYYHRETEKYIDGLQELIREIEDKQDRELSSFLWNQLSGFAENNVLKFDILNKNVEDRPDGRYRFTSEYEESSTLKLLRSSKWLVNSQGEFVSPSEIEFKRLPDDYSDDLPGAAHLIEILAFKKHEEMIERAEDDDSHLTDEQKEKIAYAEKLMAYEISETELAEFLEFRRRKEAKKSNESSRSEQNASENDSELNGLFDSLDETANEIQGERASHQTTSNVIKDIVHRTISKPSATSARLEDDEETDADELIPSSVDYSKKIERAKEKSAAEIDKIAYSEELYNKAVQLTKNGKYTIAWFNTLLEMENINSGETNAYSKEVSISFARVERDPGTNRTLILKHPNRYIPQFMEDLADIPLVLHMGDQTKKLVIEVASIVSYTLRVKLKNGTDIADIDLNTVSSATIDAKSPAFLLEALRKQFAELELADDFNMKDNLCENIEFVFGPPGTGKTTHLARSVLIPMMEENSECRVLVLTPTNKAADVLVKRIMEVSGSDRSYEDWLVRFGGTADEELEKSPVFKDKTFDIRTHNKNVTVTTIARFPYDFFMPQGARVFLNGLNWDYIVIDEASMIPLANIIYPLYKKTPRKFIIAGDPFQIEPITSVDIWKNENIYTMVELDSFTEPKTRPHPYKVELLTTQYRSVPAIGGIFSSFAYGGILKHHRSADSQRPLNVGNELEVKTLNIIKYPVSKYESIYRPKRLQQSSCYQIYSALFTFEYVCYLSRAIAKNNPGNLFKIGIIAPYRAQSDMIDKLLAAERLPPEVDVQVGTIHGFQGDECDIIFAVFNTPPTISDSKEMFLNKRNIINVSISRARDYLFVVMPDDNTENISHLRLVKRVEELICKTDDWKEAISSDLEKVMFDEPDYLEKNAFSTSHQAVNVYGLPEKCYEVRTEDSAVDVQIHRGNKKISG